MISLVSEIMTDFKLGHATKVTGPSPLLLMDIEEIPVVETERTEMNEYVRQLIEGPFRIGTP